MVGLTCWPLRLCSTITALQDHITTASALPARRNQCGLANVLPFLICSLMGIFGTYPSTLTPSSHERLELLSLAVRCPHAIRWTAEDEMQRIGDALPRGGIEKRNSSTNHGAAAPGRADLQPVAAALVSHSQPP